MTSATTAPPEFARAAAAAMMINSKKMLCCGGDKDNRGDGKSNQNTPSRQPLNPYGQPMQPGQQGMVVAVPGQAPPGQPMGPLAGNPTVMAMGKGVNPMAPPPLTQVGRMQQMQQMQTQQGMAHMGGGGSMNSFELRDEFKKVSSNWHRSPLFRRPILPRAALLWPSIVLATRVLFLRAATSATAERANNGREALAIIANKCKDPFSLPLLAERHLRGNLPPVGDGAGEGVHSGHERYTRNTITCPCRIDTIPLRRPPSGRCKSPARWSSARWTRASSSAWPARPPRRSTSIRT